jgi:hypothetical protein
LVAVEEGRGDHQHIHEGGSCDETFYAAIGLNQRLGTILIRVGGRNLIRRHEQSLKTNEIGQQCQGNLKITLLPGSKMESRGLSQHRGSSHYSLHANR